MATIRASEMYQTAFHGSLINVMAKGEWIMVPGTETIPGERHIIEKRRTMRYRFWPHFHPYVQTMDRRLVERSVAGLQALDTEYVSAGEGLYRTLPRSLRVRLPVGLVLQIPSPGDASVMETVTLVGGTEVTLRDGAPVLLAGVQTTLPGDLILTERKRALRVQLADGTRAEIAFDDAIPGVVTLEAPEQVTLPESVVITGADGMLRRLTQPEITTLPPGTEIAVLGALPRPRLYREIFNNTAAFVPSELVQQPWPVRDLDFTSGGAYSVYNWELFYHIPLAIAMHLSKNRRYPEAQRWLHYIFDPTDSSDGPTPERFWKVKPFQFIEVKQVGEILQNLSTGVDGVLQQDTINAIDAWKDQPFRPHLIARYRQTPYMYKTVFTYLDNLIAWGDSLFLQDTGESITEATQLYVLAALILGERPQPVPAKGTVAPVTYASRRSKWDALGNTLEQMEADIPFDFAPLPAASGAGSATGKFAVLQSAGASLYFCVPHNDRLLQYWDTVADRLFKIRNSLNLQGIFRKLPLFEPPIDPALLARAAASGLSIAAVVAGANQPLPLVRFPLLLQRALELCQEVKTLGGTLLSALEKKDGEALGILRAHHESSMLTLAKSVKYSQWQEAVKNFQGAEAALANLRDRYTYNERQLGRDPASIAFPAQEAVDAKELASFNLSVDERPLAKRPVAIDIATDPDNARGKISSSFEAEELSKVGTARDVQDAIKALNLGSQALALLPDLKTNIHFWGIGAALNIIGGAKLAQAGRIAAEVISTIAERAGFESSSAGRVGGLDRRMQEWDAQSQTLAGDFNQALKQARAAEIRQAIAQNEWANHQVQIDNAAAIEHFLSNEKGGKTTNEAFYAWMTREVRGLYNRAYDLALETARKAERALQFELGDPRLTFVDTQYKSGKEGLFAGEKLFLELKRMELSYHDLNWREYELTRHISLLQIDPNALLELRLTGKCRVTIPEDLFDLDCPGHYFRRIKNVAVSIPCVAGPYASVHCRVALVKSAIRTTPRTGEGYASTGSEDDRIDVHYGAGQAIVTSSGQNDSGLFEVNLRDERVLPFEGCGVFGEWELTLPQALRQFDSNTISDVILHMRYTAREGGDGLRKVVQEYLGQQIKQANGAGCVRLFSMRHEFPSEWAVFVSQWNAGAPEKKQLKMTLRAEHYPYWSRDHLATVKRSDVVCVSAGKVALQPGGVNAPITLVKDKNLGDDVWIGTLGKAIAQPLGEVTMEMIAAAPPTDLWLAIAWGG